MMEIIEKVVLKIMNLVLEEIINKDVIKVYFCWYFVNEIFYFFECYLVFLLLYVMMLFLKKLYKDDE